MSKEENKDVLNTDDIKESVLEEGMSYEEYCDKCKKDDKEPMSEKDYMAKLKEAKDDDSDEDDKDEDKKSDDDDDSDDDKKDDKDEDKDEDVKEEVSYAEVATASVATITEGMEDLSEDFKSKAETIMEAAIASEAKKIRESVEAEFEEKYSQLETELAEKVDEYLAYVVESWVEENKVEVEKGLKVTLAENFMNDMKRVLEENYVMVPDEKLDLFEKVEGEKAGLEAQVSELTESLLESKKENLEHEKANVIAKLSEGLADTQKEKFSELVEGVEAKDIETFEGKAKTIRESVFEKAKAPAEKQEDLKEEKAEESPVSRYTKAAKRYNHAKL